MKEAMYNFFTAVLTLLILFGVLHSMNNLCVLNDYNYARKAAEKNTGLAAAGHDIPAVSLETPAEEMRTEPAPVTAEELSYIYIDGIKFDFPITLADIWEHFETIKFVGGYDEETSKYGGSEILMKNGIGAYRIAYAADTKKPSPEECIVNSIGCLGPYSEKYFPQVTAAGIDIFRTSKDEIIRLAALDENEYLTSDKIVRPVGEDGYTALNFDRSYITYYKKDDPEDMSEIEKIIPTLIKTELRLPENYSGEVPKNKEELREFALEYYAYDENDTSWYTKTEREIEATVNDLYLTAYEFLADTSDEYNALYYELTEIDSLTKYESESGKTYYTGYLKVTARCCIEGYEAPVQTDMILKAGDRLGDALIIYIDF